MLECPTGTNGLVVVRLNEEILNCPLFVVVVIIAVVITSFCVNHIQTFQILKLSHTHQNTHTKQITS